MAGSYFESDVSFWNEDRFFQTGDLGFLHDGEIHISGRVGDKIKVSGQTYFSNDFELAVETLPFVRPGRVAAFQIHDRIIILVEANTQAVLARCEEHRTLVASCIYERVHVKVSAAHILFVAPGQLEKTSSGKLRRRAIAEKYLRGELRIRRAPPGETDRSESA
jgi:acyl-CoA synthetase (AMP-forming)/AMP-acid ligase II